jgi:hypothetical protein
LEKGQGEGTRNGRGRRRGVALSSNEQGKSSDHRDPALPSTPTLCSHLVPVHPLLWEKGKVTDLGNLGGKTGTAGGNLAWGINHLGQVIFIDLEPEVLMCNGLNEKLVSNSSPKVWCFWGVLR